jgi:hypothetical protein
LAPRFAAAFVAAFVRFVVLGVVVNAPFFFVAI